MITLRKIIPALCLASSLAGVAAHAATAATADGGPPPPAPDAGEWQHHRGHHDGMFLVLHKLNLTAEQKTQIKSIFAGQKSRFEALRTGAEANRDALAATAPTDPGYPALIQTAQTDAATRIQLMSETWAAIYGTVLTKPQQEAIPGIVAAARQAREARMAAWKAQHTQAQMPAVD